ncbi:MAG: FMN-binding protein [Phycisphaerae bacterium]|nr:FMN-binding protein [Phycisphaerae bacterium]
MKNKIGLTIVTVIIVVTWWGCGGSSRVDRTAVWQSVFPDAIQLREINLDSPEGKKMQLHTVESEKGTVGYMVNKQVASRSGPFWIVVYLGTDGVVKQARILSYPYTHGRAVQSEKFTVQFTHKGPGDAIRLGEDIDGMSGATMSSRAMTQGVHDAVAIVGRAFKMENLQGG